MIGAMMTIIGIKETGMEVPSTGMNTGKKNTSENKNESFYSIRKGHTADPGDRHHAKSDTIATGVANEEGEAKMSRAVTQQGQESNRTLNFLAMKRAEREHILKAKNSFPVAGLIGIVSL